jgi:hypothetical protein
MVSVPVDSVEPSQTMASGTRTVCIKEAHVTRKRERGGVTVPANPSKVSALPIPSRPSVRCRKRENVCACTCVWVEVGEGGGSNKQLSQSGAAYPPGRCDGRGI